VFVTVTVAPGTRAFDESVTVPDNEPKVCAEAVARAKVPSRRRDAY
jgi:hypothetical protein